MTLEKRESLRCMLVGEFGLPKWFENDCPHCNRHMPLESILGFGVETTPKMFGNIAVTYLCPSCESMCELQFVKAVLGIEDIVPYLKSEERPTGVFTREELINSSEHNLDA